jgi:hypothetical protein
MVQSSTQFLTRLNQSQNSWIQHRFKEPVGSGLDDPSAVLHAVKQKLQAERDQERAREILKMFEQFPDEALALAAHNINLPNRSPEEKTQRDDKYRRQYLSHKPATERQTWMLREKLKYTGTIDSQQHASDLINQRLNSQN